MTVRYSSLRLICIDSFEQVPLDHHNKQNGTIRLFVRDVVALSKIGHKLPTLLFLQGQLSAVPPLPFCRSMISLVAIYRWSRL